VSPIWGFELKAELPKPVGYPYHPITLGDWLKKKRIDEGLACWEVNQQLGVFDSTRYDWENNITMPLHKNREKLRNYLSILLK
jgi:predicted transcriptional regulator